MRTFLVASCAVSGVLCANAVGAEPAASTKAETLRVMTFNLAVGGEAMGQPLEQSAAVIRAAGADAVGLQETVGRPVDGAAPDNAAKLAALLGDDWRSVAQPDHPNHRGVLTRLPVVRPTAGKEGIVLRAADGREFILFNVHLPAAPYQPYLLCGIRYAEDATPLKTEEEAIRSATGARGKQVDPLVADVAAERRATRGRGTEPPPMYVTGDFNEPSFQDWTGSAARAALCPITVDWPATRKVVDAGFADAFRQIQPDPMKDRGLTWTPTTDPSDPEDRHDRIDFVFVSAGTDVKRVRVVGEDARTADVVVKPWPSDHRAVMAEVSLP